MTRISGHPLSLHFLFAPTFLPFQSQILREPVVGLIDDLHSLAVARSLAGSEDRLLYTLTIAFAALDLSIVTGQRIVWFI